MKNNKVKFIFVALLFATQVEAFSSCSTSSVNEENKRTGDSTGFSLRISTSGRNSICPSGAEGGG